jgi:hypothetical protein
LRWLIGVKLAYRVEQRDIDRLISDSLKTFGSLAETEFIFEPIIIPGLLQMEQYAAAVTANTPWVRTDHAVSDPELSRAQLRRLLELAKLPTVTIQVTLPKLIRSDGWARGTTGGSPHPNPEVSPQPEETRGRWLTGRHARSLTQTYIR